MKLEIELLESILLEELKVLPDQAPLEHFVHHNNLHYFEGKKFEKAVEDVFLTYGRSPYMGLRYYRKKMVDGEIDSNFFKARLKSNGFDIQDPKLFDYIKNYLHSFKDVSELKFFRDEEVIYNADFEHLLPMDDMARKLWSELDEQDVNYQDVNYPDFHINRSLGNINKIIVPFLGTMLDQGQAYEQLGDTQKKNVWVTFKSYLDSVLSNKQLNLLDKNFGDIKDVKTYLAQYLSENCNNEGEVREFLINHLHSLPGWAGIINKVSHNKEVIPRKDVFINMYDYLLMRIILQNIVKDKLKKQVVPVTTPEQIKANVFYCIFYFSSDHSFKELFELFINLNPLVLKRTFQQAYEDTYQSLILTGLANKKNVAPAKAKYQMFFCIDDREESFRRYLEEVSPKVETFGVAGFFGLDMMYQKVNEPRARRFCPPAATPGYLVKEEGTTRSFRFASFFHDTHHSLFKSILFNFIYAPFKSLEWKWHLFFPRTKRALFNYVFDTHVKRIDYYHSENIGDDKETHLKQGYTLDEAALRVSNILKGAGLVKDFASYVIMIGHGHDSFNNPHVAAYRCGACSGANAAPNAKIFAEMANDPNLRSILISKYDIAIPDSCRFIGGYHDTCNDNVELYGIDHDKVSQDDITELKEIILKARQLNAKERCLKFYQEPKNITPAKALHAVETRAWRVAEPRPELNHATNALCIVGKRDLTKNIFLDRKAFLVSYDSSIDPETHILTSLLSAVIPVCAGINLEYYFSKVDTENYGSGSKTSHNVSGLVGVMNGVRGDLRTGLVWQMVEYHDPLRILFVIEATEQAINNVMDRNEEVRNLIQNGWISLAIVDKDDSSKIKMFRDGKFYDFSPLDKKFDYYKHSSDVETGLIRPVHFAYLGASNHG